MADYSKDGQPWDRQPDEGAKAFAAFTVYADLPADKRSLLEAARKYSNRPDIKSVPGRIAKWSTDFNWLERATLKDAWRDDLRREAEAKTERDRAEEWAKRRIQIRDDAWEVAQSLLDRAREIVEMPVTKKTETEELVKEDIDAERGVIVQFITKTVHIEPLAVRARDAALIAKSAVEMARLAAGLSNNTPTTEEDMSKYSEDDLRRIASGRPVARR